MYLRFFLQMHSFVRGLVRICFINSYRKFKEVLPTSTVTAELRQLADISVKYGKLKSTFEVKSHEAKLCATRLAQSTVSQVGQL